MPIVAWWPNLIVIFELTMLGAILATVHHAASSPRGLGRRMPKLYDPEVTNGKILVGVAAPGDARMADVERALLAAPAPNSRPSDRSRHARERSSPRTARTKRRTGCILCASG